MRHGTSRANVEGWTAGWSDVGLVPEGEADARRAARILAAADLRPDVVHTSMLTRARRTAELVVEALDLPADAVHATWRLNERHAGAFEGATREELQAAYGRARVRAWRRTPEARPVPLAGGDPRHPVHDPRYRGVDPGLLPSGESAQDVLGRLLPYWEGHVVPDLLAGRRVLVVTHEHVLRVLVAHVRGVPSPQTGEVPGRVPWLFELDPATGRVERAAPLADPEGTTL